jgi:predicted Zn-dependent protease
LVVVAGLAFFGALVEGQAAPHGAGNARANEQKPARAVAVAASAPTGRAIFTATSEQVNRAMGLGSSELIRLTVNAQPDSPFGAGVMIDGRAYALQMWPHSLRAPGYTLRAQKADGTLVNVEPGPERTMRGTLTEAPGSVVAGSLLDDGLHAMVRLPWGNGRHDEVWIEPVAAYVPGADPEQYVVYRASSVTRDAGECGVNDAWLARQRFTPPAAESEGGVATGGSMLTCAELACDADYEYFLSRGSSVLNVQNRITSIINTVNIQYEAEVAISHIITTIIVRTEEPDPYTSTNATTLLTQLRAEWNNNQTGIVRDLVQMFTGKDLDGSTVGLAWTVGAVCTTNAYCLVQSDYNNTYSCATDLSAHELGHLWGAQHCTCSNPAYTMNAIITCANRHDPVNSIPPIIAHRDSRWCLAQCEYSYTTLPFFDDFPDPTIDNKKWTGVDGVAVITQGLNEPSPPYSLNIDGSASGGDQIRSAKINASALSSLTLSYWYQRTGDGDPPEIGDDLLIEYLNAAGNWVEVQRQLGGGPDMTTYEHVTVAMPSGALHANFRVRFRLSQVTPSAGADDWFVDDVSITGTVPPSNDNCANAIISFAGSVAFTTVGATTDGPNEPGACDGNGFSQIANDVWYIFPAQCTGTATISLCGANFDAKLAVYYNNCPAASGQVLACSDNGCGTAPQVSLPVIYGNLYRIRIGGAAPNANGSGTMVITCTPRPCPADIDGNGSVNIDDLFAVIAAWGPCPAPPTTCPADVSPANGNGQVNIDDLFAIINAWGACP